MTDTAATTWVQGSLVFDSTTHRLGSADVAYLDIRHCGVRVSLTVRQMDHFTATAATQRGKYVRASCTERGTEGNSKVKLLTSATTTQAEADYS
jgi:hypothetical protein